MKKISAKQKIEDEIVRVQEQASTLDVGSEEYLNACKAQNQLSETAGKLRKVDPNLLISGGSSVAMFILYMIFSETHIVDTRPIQFCRSLFKR